jgi:hypothetical protein
MATILASKFVASRGIYSHLATLNASKYRLVGGIPPPIPLAGEWIFSPFSLSPLCGLLAAMPLENAVRFAKKGNAQSIKIFGHHNHYRASRF